MLKAKGMLKELSVLTLGGNLECRNVQLAEIEIQLSSKQWRKLKVSIIPEIIPNTCLIDWNVEKVKWKHLRNIKFPLSWKNKHSVDMLIGTDEESSSMLLKSVLHKRCSNLDSTW